MNPRLYPVFVVVAVAVVGLTIFLIDLALGEVPVPTFAPCLSPTEAVAPTEHGAPLTHWPVPLGVKLTDDPGIELDAP